MIPMIGTHPPGTAGIESYGKGLASVDMARSPAVSLLVSMIWIVI